jgi:hypothetical protein
MTEVELAWVAGLLEGQAGFLREDDLGIRVQIELRDGAVLERMRDLTGLGTVGGPFPDEFARDKPRQYHRYVAGEARGLVALLDALQPHFGDTTRKRVHEAIRRLRAMLDP